jgi:hypothetical protein
LSATIAMSFRLHQIFECPTMRGRDIPIFVFPVLQLAANALANNVLPVPGGP